MKRAKIEATEPIKTRKMGRWITVQLVEECILVLNIYDNRILGARHCINIYTGEYATLTGNEWAITKIEKSLGLEYDSRYYYYDSERLAKESRMSSKDKKYIEDLISLNSLYASSAIDKISNKETEYGRDRKEITEMNRISRVNKLMDEVPDIPKGIKKWINQKELGGMDFMLKDRDTGLWTCSACGKESTGKEITKKEGKKPKNNDIVICPKCGKKVKILSRKWTFNVTTRFAIIQPMNDEKSVIRHFKARIYCEPKMKKTINIQEEIRILMYKINSPERNKRKYSIFYEQFTCPSYVQEGKHHEGCFDNKGNPSNKKEDVCYLYDAGIEEAFKDTVYEPWSRLFIQMAAADVKVDYNRLMVTQDDTNLINVIELLFKGRFTQLLKETSESISIWTGAYCGPLKLYGNTIEDVFDIGDRQKINRIRENNGGKLMLKWMQWSDINNEKISEKAMTWILQNKLSTKDLEQIMCKLSLEKSMNYIERQRKEQYKGKNAKQILSQYEDYIRMCEKLNKNTADEMVFRPRELKRRHNEAVAELERLNAELVASEYSEKFGEAEEVLKDIHNKFSYEGEKFFIKVPEKIADIVAEGRYLHHCVAGTDRYFDRIKQNETYICFLRKVEEPDIPFYTIEVEPGGTIRQHRGMFDEEPELDKVKPFLREWQKVIRKRMSKKDHEFAAVSKIRREENIAELREKNNTRVLKGLEEDFMEAI